MMRLRVWLADELEVPVVSNIYYFINLWPMKTELIFYVLDCNVLCILGIPFFQMVNPTADWLNHSVKADTVLVLAPLEVVQRGSPP